MIFAYTEPGTGSITEEVLSHVASPPDYVVIYEDVAGFGVVDKPIGPVSGLTVSVVARVSETTHALARASVNALQALIGYKGTLTITAGDYTPTAWARMRMVTCDNERHAPNEYRVNITFRQVGA